MSRLTLYNDDNMFSDAGGKLDEEIREFISPIFKEHCNLGYSPREISHVILSAVAFQETISIIHNRMIDRQRKQPDNGVENESN